MEFCSCKSIDVELPELITGFTFDAPLKYSAARYVPIQKNAGGKYMQKINMTTPLVEMDGDEMTRVLWRMIKDRLILPYIDLKTEYYDLGLPSRNMTGDQVTVDAAVATKKYGVAVKCATITPNRQRMIEFRS